MLKKSLVIIPFNLPWEWSTDYTNQTAFVLAKENSVICYMWSETFSLKEYFQRRKFPILIKSYSKNLFLFFPIYFIPFRRFKTIVKINQKLNILLLNIFVKFLQNKKNINKKLIWVFDPSTRFIIDLLGKNWSIIYDCVDFWQATAKTRKDKNTIERNEKRLTKESDLVTAISVFMKKHLEKYRKDIHLVPQGFRVKDFENKSNYKATKIKAKKPIIGFAGAVNDRLDYNLLLPLAKRNPNWSFVIWGPVLEEEKILEKVKLMKKELLSLPNVSTGFLKDRRKLPGVFKQFDISMIPYDVSQAFNKNCYPMKIFEFFYLGKPIVSTDIIELRRFTNLIRIGKNVREWEEIINDLLLKKWPINYKKEQKKLAKENSWQNKIKTITRFLK